MSVRELVVLGTASQVPTRARNHVGALLRFDGAGLLFDPGEGTQRQLALAGLAASSITHILVTHVHGDHCLGLPGVLQRLSLDGIAGPVHLHHPAEAAVHIDRLRFATPYEQRTEVVVHRDRPGVVADTDGFRIRAAALSHSVPTLGWRLEEPDGHRLDPDALARAGVPPRARRELVAAGHVEVDGRRVELDEVSTPRPGQSVAFVMDTRDGPGARELAEAADLLVIEATFLEPERELAEEVGHLTAAGAARIARDAGARRVVLTHLSQRYPDPAGHLAEARAVAPTSTSSSSSPATSTGWPCPRAARGPLRGRDRARPPARRGRRPGGRRAARPA